MNGRLLISRKLGVVATLSLLGGTVALACSSESVDSQAPDPTHEVPLETPVTSIERMAPHRSGLQVVSELAVHQRTLKERFLPTPEVLLRQHGDRLVPRLNQGSPAATLQVDLGSNAQGRLLLNPIENREQALALTPQRARDVQGVVQADGRVVYQDAYTNSDLILTANHNRLVHTLVLHDVNTPADFHWQLEIGAGMRQVESSRNETSLVDAAGHLRLTVREVSITGADGSVTQTALVLDRNGDASLRVDPLTLSYPAVVQFEIEAPPIALAIIPPEIIKARMMVLLDTSGSMMWGFDNGTNQGGDSDDRAVFCDNNITTGFTCSANVACSLTSATPGLNLWPANDPTGSPSRMLAAKLALQNVFNAHSGLIDFGLMRFREHDTSCNGPDAYCCQTRSDATTVGRCTTGQNQYFGSLRFDGCSTDSNADADGCDLTCNTNADAAGNDACNCNNNDDCDGNGGSIGSGDNNCVNGLCVVTHDLTTYAGQSTAQCEASVGAGGRVLVLPNTGSAPRVRPWVDFIEDFCSSTGSAGGAPRNPELRADGFTPLAYSVDTARTDWYQLAYNAWNTDNTGHALYDEKFDCRPYVLVNLTDGEDTCAADPTDDPPDAVAALRAVSPVNPVTIYTMGMGDTDGLDVGVLNEMMQQGGSGRTTAPIASNQSQIEAAFADIVAETVKFEICNTLDDNCNDRIDEGLNVYQECAVNGDCGSSDCDFGRCGCTTDGQCASGYACAADDFCRPACHVGVSVCRNDGVRKCGATGGQCCVDDGSDTCTDLEPLPGSAEVCNRIDDDCDGEIDEGFPGGCPQCIPRPEVCNGEDDDCDGQVDNDDGDLVGIGAPCGSDEGICTAGTINCVDGEPVCENEDPADDEVCNGLDDDCDGQTDGQTQACYTGPDGTEDVGVCHGGSQECIAPLGDPGVPCSGDDCWGVCVGEVTPTTEICDGLDNDCDDSTDEGVPAVVQSCDDDGDCEGSNNCQNNACRCASGSCADGYVCGGGNTCFDEDIVTGDQCCDPNFDDKCGHGTCAFGAWTCSGNQVSCVGSTGPSDEICDGLDNDCDDLVDEDLPSIGTPCETDDGICGGELQCVVEYAEDDVDHENPLGGAIVCVATSGGEPEICNQKDDDCDGQIDEVPDIYENDDTGMLSEDGVECEVPGVDATEGRCRAGEYKCIEGVIVCEGAIQPGTEVCNGVDDDCDGELDEGTCSPNGTCIDGVCRFECNRGEFPCDPGFVCQGGFCIPDDEVSTANNSNNSNGAGTGGSSGNGGSANGGSANTGNTGGTASGGSANGGSGTGGTGTGNGTGGGAGADGDNTGPSSSLTSGSGVGGSNSDRVYGLASGGGGCACQVGKPRVPSEFGLLLGLVLVGGVVRRRRTSSGTVL